MYSHMVLNYELFRTYGAAGVVGGGFVIVGVWCCTLCVQLCHTE